MTQPLNYDSFERVPSDTSEACHCHPADIPARAGGQPVQPDPHDLPFFWVAGVKSTPWIPTVRRLRVGARVRPGEGRWHMVGTANARGGVHRSGTLRFSCAHVTKEKERADPQTWTRTIMAAGMQKKPLPDGRYGGWLGDGKCHAATEGRAGRRRASNYVFSRLPG